MQDSFQILQAISSSFSILLSIAQMVALLIVAIVARNRRPDVGPWLLGAAAAGLALAVFGPPVTFAIHTLAARYDENVLISVLPIANMTGALLSGAAFVPLLVAIFRLSKPPPTA